MSENTSLNSLYSQLYSAFKEAFPKSKGFNGQNYCFSGRSLLLINFILGLKVQKKRMNLKH